MKNNLEKGLKIAKGVLKKETSFRQSMSPVVKICPFQGHLFGPHPKAMGIAGNCPSIAKLFGQYFHFPVTEAGFSTFAGFMLVLAFIPASHLGSHRLRFFLFRFASRFHFLNSPSWFLRLESLNLLLNTKFNLKAHKTKQRRKIELT